MINRIRHWLSQAPVEDSVERRLAPVLQAILIGLALAIAGFLIVSALAFGARVLQPVVAWPNYVFLLVVLGVLMLLRRGHFRPAVTVLLITMMAIQVFNLIVTNLDHIGEALLVFMVPLTIAGVLMGRRTLWLVALSSIGLVLADAALELQSQPGDSPLTATIILFVLVTLVISFFLDVAGSALRQALNEAVQRRQEVEGARSSLEHRAIDLAQVNHDLQIEIQGRQEIETHLRLLADASAVLKSSLRYEDTVSAVTQLVVPALADWSVTMLVGPDNAIQPLAIAHADPAKAPLVRALESQFAPDPDIATGLYGVVRTGEPLFHPEVGEDWLKQTIPNPDYRNAVLALGICSSIIVPLIARDRILGAFALISGESGRRYGENHLLLAQEIARHIAAAIDNAQLVRDAEDQRSQLEVTLTSIGDAVISTDVRGAVVFMNRVAETLTGWSQDEARGLPLDTVFRIVNQATRQTVENPVAKVLREGRIVGLANHTLLLRRDGHEYPIDDSGAPIRDPSGAITGVVLVFRDITERTEAERQLEHLAALVESSDDAIIGIALDGRITSWNPGAQRMYGYSAREVVGQPVAILAPNERADEFPTLLDTMRQGERIDHFETIRVRKDGEPIAVSLTISPIRDINGQLIGVSKIARDISERARAARERERLLQEVEAQAERLQTVLRQMPAGVVLAEAASGEAVLINEAAKRIIGQQDDSTPAAAGGGGLVPVEVEYLDGRPYDRRETPLQRALRRGETVENEDLVLRRADGSRVTIQANAAPIMNRDREIIAAVSAFVDVTERRQATERIALLQRLTASFSEALTLGDVVRVATVEGAAALRADTVVILLLDASGETLVPAHEFRHDPSRPAVPSIPLAVPSLIADTVRRGLPLWVENREQFARYYPDQAEDFAATGSHATTCLPLFSQSAVMGCLGVGYAQPHAFDDMERTLMLAFAQQCGQAVERARLYEAEQQARARAEEADALKLKFLAMISHELRTPLASIKGFTSTLLAPDIEWTADQQDEFLRIMDDEANKLNDLVEQLLDVSSLEAGTLRIRPEAVTLDDILERARFQLETAAAHHVLKFELLTDYAPVNADPQRIGQVIVNLVENAAKYSPPGSQIAVAARPLDGRERDTVQVDVSDEGEGVPATERTAIFEAFRRAGKNVHKRGAGLGLAICKGVVEAHGGRIWIQDRPGPGTTFSFTLPVAGEEPPADRD